MSNSESFGDARERIIMNSTINEKTGCWEWFGIPRENGYCRTTYNNKSWYLHRLSFRAFYGVLPDDKLVCHKCDNRKCCNPDHLFLGNHKDNMQDAVKKNRQAKGDALPQTKILSKYEIDIFNRIKAGEIYKNIGKSYNITPQTVSKFAIKKGIRRNVINK